MRSLAVAILLALLSACASAPPPSLTSSPGPDSSSAPAANLPYRPVLVGTVYHGIGSKP
jgi:hypothetical protein